MHLSLFVLNISGIPEAIPKQLCMQIIASSVVTLDGKCRLILRSRCVCSDVCTSV